MTSPRAMSIGFTGAGNWRRIPEMRNHAMLLLEIFRGDDMSAFKMAAIMESQNFSTSTVCSALQSWTYELINVKNGNYLGKL